MTLEDIMICARTVYGEARGETLLSKRAVAHVMINRWRGTGGQWKRDHTLGAACLRWRQFSAWNANDPNREKMQEVDLSSKSFRECLRAVLEALDARADPTHGATHYKTAAVNPRWARNKVSVVSIGSHEYFNNVR